MVDCTYVRGEVLKALVWLGTPTDLDETSQLIVVGLREQATDRASRATQAGALAMPDSLAHRLLGCVCDRLAAATTQLDGGGVGADVSAAAAVVALTGGADPGSEEATGGIARISSICAEVEPPGACDVAASV